MLEKTTIDVPGQISATFVDVFETMLTLKAHPLPDHAIPHHPDRVTGTVGFGGDNVTGATYIHLSTKTATQAAAAMLGLTPAELGETEVNDVVGEMSNMVAGGLKSTLCNAGFSCAMSTPDIIRGHSFEIEAMPDVQREVLVFECDGEQIAVEVHIKFS